VGHLTGKILGAVAGLSMLVSSPALAASRVPASQPSVMSPWVALSALGSTASSAALCANLAASAATTAAQANPSGCVFPQVDAVPVAADAPALPAPVAPGISAGGLGFIPILLGLAAVAAGLAAIAAGSGEDGDTISLPPVSPS